MIEINISGIKKSFGFKKVLDGFNMEVKSFERVALIGPNGCGKSTIFKIIYGLEGIDSGNISIRKGASIGLLSQIPTKEDDNVIVRDILLRNFQELFDLEKKLREYEEKIANSEEGRLENILKTYGNIQEEYANKGGYVIDEKISRICNGFKISEEMLKRTFNTLSGGEKTIVNLAAIIINNPDILLLDEPTNHLDIETLEWFEHFLVNYKGTIIISSHDRYFLDKVVTRTILIDKGMSEIYHGNYSYYLEESERRILAEFSEYRNQQKQIEAMKNSIKKLKEWGERGDNPSFFKRAVCIERKLEKIELLDKPNEKRELPLEIEINNRSGKDVLSVVDLGIVLGDKVIFEDAKVNLKYGDKVCLMGCNGTGKSTFIKAILNGDNICYGEVKIGSNVSIGYIPQEIHFENESATVMEEVRKYYIGLESSLRSSLAKFLFYGEDVFKRVGNLSGGEKVRLKLFELIQKRANFLILDEPTNHIDIDTKEMLEEALKEYKGTLLFISHDRYFINRVSKKVIWIENKKLEDYIGNYDDYRIQKEKRKIEELNKNKRKRWKKNAIQI